MEDKKNIPGIYNYCDRWCERCPFTDRCLNYKMLEDTFDGIFKNEEKIIEHLGDIFSQIIDLLKEEMEKQGVDWNEFVEEAFEMKIEEPELTKHQTNLVKSAKDYSKMVEQWFEENQKLLRGKADEFNRHVEMGIEIEKQAAKLTDALEKIQFYMFFISAKLNRAISGKQDGMFVDVEDVEQSDENGNAKIAKIAIERSLRAWEVIRSHFPERTDELLDFLVILTKLRKGILKEFPDVDKFIRPGFDEEKYDIQQQA